MLKLEIKMDEAKIDAVGKYTPESIYEALDEGFAYFGLVKSTYEDGTICYSGTGDRGDFGAFGSMITGLCRESWFMDYVTKWLWYNSDDGRDEDDFSIEDVLYYYTKRESVA